MAGLPSFRRSNRADNPNALPHHSSSESVEKSKYNTPLETSQIKRATRTRMTWTAISALCLFISVVFLTIVEIGNTYNLKGLRNIWFIRLNLSDVIPISVPDAALLNTVARTLGLHDYYQVGLWNYCEGYEATGISDCTAPHTLYWFNPVQIIQSQLLAGAQIQLPEEISSILNIIRIASHWMFGLFLAGACFSFFLIPFMLFSVKSRWIAFIMMLITAINAILIIAASVIATAMFIIMRDVFQQNTSVNIGAEIGNVMFAMMWIASGFALIAFLIQLCLTCCCASRRDVRRGKKKGSKKAYEIS